MCGQNTLSFLRRIERMKAMPMVGSSVSRKRMVVKGISSSSTQPSSVTRVSL